MGGFARPLLHRMQGQRLIKASWEDGEHGKPRKYYALTPKGQRLLKEGRGQWSDLRGAVDTLLMGGA